MAPAIAFRIEAGAAEILIDPFLSDNPSWDKVGAATLRQDSTQGGDDEGDCVTDQAAERPGELVERPEPQRR